MPDRFCQITITKNIDPTLPTFHVIWVDEHQVVESGDYWGIGGVIVESAQRMEPPSAERWAKTA